MAVRVSSHGRAIWGGLAAASVLVGLMFLGRLSLGVPLVPELLAEIVFAWVPLPLFALTLGLLGAWAKPVAFVSLVGLYVVLLTFWGWGTLRWIEAKRPAPAWLRAWGSAVLLWTLTVIGLFRELTGPQAMGGIAFSLGSLLLLHSIYGFGLALFPRGSGAPRQAGSGPERRPLVILAVLLSVGLLGWPASPVAGQALRSGQPAPEIAGAPWINSPPLTLERLRGRVVLVEFWTYG